MSDPVEYPDKTRLVRRQRDRQIYQFLIDNGPTLSLDIGKAFPDLTQRDRSGIMKRLRDAGLVDYEIVIADRMSIRRWRVI